MLSAFLTAFYTTRQITLTFLGKPRTAGAAHAPESVRRMTVPLDPDYALCGGLGWFGIPASFPVIGGTGPQLA